MPNLFKALGSALSSNAFQGVAQGLSSDLRRRKVFDEIKEQKDDRNTERDFVSQLNLKLLDGDPDAAQAVLQEFSGRIPANTFSEGAKLVRGLRSEIEQKGVADRQAFDAQEQARFQVDALSKGASPEETAILGEAGRQGQGLKALLGIRKQREQAAQDQGTDEAFVQRALGQGVDPKQVGILRTLGRGARGADLSKLAEGDSGGKAPKLSTTAQNKIADIQSVNDMAGDLITMLDDPDVKNSLGPLAGRISNIQNIAGAGALPESVVTFRSRLFDMVDLWLRERTGAAVTADEVNRVMNEIIGGATTDPNAIKARLERLVSDNNRRLGRISQGAIGGAGNEGDESDGKEFDTVSDREIAQRALAGEELAIQEALRRGLIK